MLRKQTEDLKLQMERRSVSIYWISSVQPLGLIDQQVLMSLLTIKGKSLYTDYRVRAPDVTPY